MPYRRQLSWSAAMRDLRRDRAPRSAESPLLAASMQRARALDRQRIAVSRSLVIDRAYDYSAIMTAATAEAKVQQLRGSGASWQQLMASALRFAWDRAKAQRALLN